MAKKAAAKVAIYKGSGAPSLRPEVYELKHRDKTHRFPAGVAVPVTQELATKLSKIEGDRFDIKKEG